VDLSKNEKALEKIFNLLDKANDKPYGRPILFRDLVLFVLDKISEKDLGKLQEDSLDEMEKVTKLLDEHNQKNGTALTLGEFFGEET